MAHGLEAIDWNAPWQQPFRAVGRALASHALEGWAASAFAPCPPPAMRAPPLSAQRPMRPSPLGASSVAEALNAASALTACRAAPVCFVPQSDLPADEAYEAFIARTLQVPTRDGLHDFFNGLSWLHFPHTKRRLNQLQAAQIARSGVQPVRGPARDGLTVFDENAAFFQGPDALWSALVAKDWTAVFVTLRPLWAQSTLVLFGHALLEKLVAPRKPITAHVYRAQAATNSIADLDRWMAADLSAEKIASKPFAHLPVLGVPGWWPANIDASFYDDGSVFRPPRQSPNSIGSIAADWP